MTTSQAKRDCATPFAPLARLVLLIAGCYGLMAVNFVSASHAFWLPSIAVDFRNGEAASGALLSCAFWGMMGACVLAGPLADRFGSRGIVVISAISQSIGMYALSSASSFGMALAGASVASVGAGLIMVAASPMIFKLFPDSREKMAYLQAASYSVGTVLIVALGMVLFSKHWPWRSAYRVIALLVPLYGVAFIFLTPPSYHSEATGRTRVRTLHLQGQLGLMLASVFLTSFAVVGAVFWMPSYLQQVSRGSRMIGGTGLMLNSSVSIVTAIIGSSVISRFGSRSIALVGGGISVVALTVASVCADPRVVIACFCTISLGGTVIGPIVFARAASCYPHAGATMYSALHAISNLGAAVGVLAVGAMGQLWGLSATLLLMCVVPAVNMAILALLLPSRLVDGLATTDPTCTGHSQ